MANGDLGSTLWRGIPLLACAVWLVGCSCDPTTNDVDAAVAREDALSAGEDAGATCARWRLLEVPITSAEFVSTHPATRTTDDFRIRAHYTPPDGCTRRAMFVVDVDLVERSSSIRLRVWQREGTSCALPASPDARLVTLRAYRAGAWSIRDAVGGEPLLSISVAAGANRCAPCTSDCLLEDESDPSAASCADSCESDEDCTATSTRCDTSGADGLAFTCRGDACVADDDCPGERRCVMSTCRPGFDGEEVMSGGRACGCDTDCGEGYACVARPSGESHCEVLCESAASGWCPLGICRPESSACGANL